jgi:hypothetical protein
LGIYIQAAQFSANESTNFPLVLDEKSIVLTDRNVEKSVHDLMIDYRNQSHFTYRATNLLGERLHSSPDRYIHNRSPVYFILWSELDGKGMRWLLLDDLSVQHLPEAELDFASQIVHHKWQN